MNNNDQVFSLMGFRHDSDGNIFAAFQHAPVGPYSFEVPADMKVATAPPTDQDR